ncbi:MAG: uracil-DNA glycosylase family protein [Polyangiaceae bacterium]
MPALDKSGKKKRLVVLLRELAACKACPQMIGPVVHGPPIVTAIYLLGQAPGPHEGRIGRPFAWTAGKTLFKWFHEQVGIDEATFREMIYMSAVARCFPGKAKGGGDRRPAPDEIERCEVYVRGEIEILEPKLVIPVGSLAISRVLGDFGKLDGVIGTQTRVPFHGVMTDVIALPHPSGASTWHRVEPGKTLLSKALGLLAAHPEIRKLKRAP